jgi:hypothetical protein
MAFRFWRDARTAAGAALLVAALVTPRAGVAAEGVALNSYNADITQTSISGISSGAFMSVQFGVAWSSIIKGIGVVAGGPYYCAQASASDVMNGYTLPIATATGPCMQGPPPGLGSMFEEAEAQAKTGVIDPLSNIKRQKIYLFHGYNDSIVAKPVSDAAADFFRHYLDGSTRGNLYYQEARSAGHAFVVNEARQGDLNACPLNRSPYIDECGYDQAGVILQHIYGALRPGTNGPPAGTIYSFDQNLYTGDHIADALSMGDEGFVFVPKDCDAGAPCRVHIALHGCGQDAGDIDHLFVEHTGYNAWADTNRIIVLYPQTKASSFMPFNPSACWDWWSYVRHDDGYVTKRGLQIGAIKAMLDVLTAGRDASAAPAEAPMPPAFLVTDTSDNAAALAWTPVPGAALYRIARSDAGGAFHPVGETSGISFGDSGLTPATHYVWRIVAVVTGGDQTPFADVTAATMAAPPACASPGNCP